MGEGGKNDLTVRLGGIYALERIARDSERDHWAVMEVLTTYVRNPAPWRSQDSRPLKEGPACMEELPTPSEFRLATDIQAVLTVLGRRDRTYENGKEQHLHLTNADLRTADLREGWLQGANLYQADLEGAHNLTVEQLLTVKTLYEAALDSPLREQIKQQRPSLLDKPPHNLDDLCAE